MTVSLKDFEGLAKVFEKNRNAKIPDSHWVEVRKMVEVSHKRFEAEEKALRPTWKTMNTPFDM
jgi:hypothetical protein